MTNLDWYSALNGAITYATEKNTRLRSITAYTASFENKDSLSHSRIKLWLHARGDSPEAKTKFPVKCLNPKTGGWEMNGKPCDAPDVE